MSVPMSSDEVSLVKRPRRISRTAVLVLGVVVIPFLLSAALNSYGPLTVDSALRMAAASVAGQTIAVLSAFTAVILTVRRRHSVSAIIAIVLIAAVVTGVAVYAITNAGDVLLKRLDLLGEMDMVIR
ncbi:hypothetical protein ACX80O_01075 [Arthrobacter sp. Hz1]